MIDFSKRQKPHFEVKLLDGRLLCVYAPTLDMLGDLKALHESEEMNIETAKKVLSTILSNNMQKATVKPSQIGELNMDEIQELIEGIIEFVGKVKTEKN